MNRTTDIIIGSVFTIFSVITIGYAAESQDFVLIDSEFSGSQSIGQTESEDFEEAQLLDIQRMGESNDFIESSSYCGNNQKEETEKCDGTDFNGETCQSNGFQSGSLSCTNFCQTISTQNCIASTPTPTATPKPTIIIISTGGGTGGGGGGGTGGGGYFTIPPTSNPTPTEEPTHSVSPEETNKPTNTPLATPSSTITPEESFQPSESPESTPQQSQEPQEAQHQETNTPEENNSETHNNIGSIIEIDNEIDTKFSAKDNEVLTGNFSEEREIGNKDEVYDYEERKSFIPTYTPNAQYINSEFKNAPPEQYEKMINRNNETLPCWIWILLAFLLGFFTRHVLGWIFDRKQDEKDEENKKE